MVEVGTVHCGEGCNFERVKHRIPAGHYMFNVNKRNTRARCEIGSKLTSKMSVANLEHTSHLVLVFLLLTLSRQMPNDTVNLISSRK